tara:strand:- start:1177 stop:1482 length:306 start_codon:yes stop_codon:yes gene_type:complete
MIDTDKYEGHTEGKWILNEYKGRPSISAVEDVETPTWVRSIATGLNPSQTADHALLLDAPLLLEEVNRLRSIVDDLYAYIVSDADISLSIIEEQMDWREEE